MQKMLDERKFEDLWELVKSSIYMVRKYKDKYEADLTDMIVFESELSSYMDQLGLGCDEEFEDEEEPQQTADSAEEDSEEEYFCPECGEKITPDMTRCPKCGVEFSFEEE